jgi:ABC-type multidrug transport system permease subunit
MPTWLRVFAEHQPLTLVINSVRSFMLTGGGGPDAIPALIWSVGLLAVFFPLGLWLYRRRTSQ